jgi:hypothetical protein
MPDHLDLGWNDIQLLRGDFTDLGQGPAIMRTDTLMVRQFMDNLYAGQRFR